MTTPADIAQFIQHWRDSTLTERSGSHSHFNELCDLLEIVKPSVADPQGEWFTFEKGVNYSALKGEACGCTRTILRRHRAPR
ncbi:MAG: hypothetical protein QG599_989 [Pseudomonadota bacterium]|nr:hypothetical protein [Pseudomonadota bacterium]